MELFFSEKTILVQGGRREFFVCMANGDFKKAYGQLDLTESEFITEEQFQKINAGCSLGIVRNYQLQENSMRNTINRKNPLSEEVFIQYQAEEGNLEYQVSHICKGYTIYVPKGAKVVLDDITLGRNYVIDSDSDTGDYLDSFEESLSDGVMEVYQIPEIFNGVHNIKVTMDDMENVTEKVQIAETGKEYRLSTMQVKEETVKGLIRAAGENMETIYHAALCGQDFQAIVPIFTGDKEILSKIEEAYHGLVSDLQENSSKPYGI